LNFPMRKQALSLGIEHIVSRPPDRGELMGMLKQVLTVF